MTRRAAALLATLLLMLGTLAGPAAQESPPAATPAPTPDQPPAPGQEQAPAVPPPPAWLPRQAATLILLDKIAAQPRTVTVKVGEQVVFGSLTIAVRACDIRPPGVPADAAAFLVITDRNPGLPGFSGWMLAEEPAASMLQHPVYDVRLAGCAG